MWLLLLSLADAAPCSAIIEEVTGRLAVSDQVWKGPAGHRAEALSPTSPTPIFEDEPNSYNALSLGDELLVAEAQRLWRLSAPTTPAVNAEEGVSALLRISERRALALTRLGGAQAGWTRARIFEDGALDPVFDATLRGSVEPLWVGAEHQWLLVRTPLGAQPARTGEGEPGGPTPPIDVKQTRESVVTAVTGGFSVIQGAPPVPCDAVEAVVGRIPTTVLTAIDLSAPTQARVLIGGGAARADATADALVIAADDEIVWLGDGIARGLVPGYVNTVALAPDGPRALWTVTPSSYEGDGVEVLPRPPEQLGASLLRREAGALVEVGRQVWEPGPRFVDQAILRGDAAEWALYGEGQPNTRLVVGLGDGQARPEAAASEPAPPSLTADADGVAAKRLALANPALQDAARRCQGWTGAWFEEPVAVQYLGLTPTPGGAAIVTTCGVLWLDEAAKLREVTAVQPPRPAPVSALRFLPAEPAWHRVFTTDAPADGGDIAIAPEGSGAWIAADGALWSAVGRRPKRAARLPGKPLALVAGPDGPFLLSRGAAPETLGVYRLVGRALAPVPGFEAMPDRETVRLVRGPNGPWLARASGLYRWANGTFELVHAPPPPLVPDRLALGARGVALSVTGAAGEVAIVAWPGGDLGQRGEIVVASPDPPIAGASLQLDELVWRGDQLLYLARVGTLGRGLFSWTPERGVQPVAVVGERAPGHRIIKDISSLSAGTPYAGLLLTLDDLRAPVLLTPALMVPLLDPTSPPSWLETGPTWFDEGQVAGPDGRIWLLHQGAKGRLEVWAVDPRLGLDL